MKAGTTWTYGALRWHPDIAVCEEKEIHYLAHRYAGGPTPLTAAHRLERARAIVARPEPKDDAVAAMRARADFLCRYLAEPVDDAWYAGLFEASPPGTWRADFSNLTALLDAEGWAAARRLASQMRVAYTLRHPVERAWSHTAFDLVQQGDADALSSMSSSELAAYARKAGVWDNSEYGRALRAMRAVLTEGELLVTWFDELRDDGLSWLRRLEGFLEVAPHDYPPHLFGRHVNRGPDVAMPQGFADAFSVDHARVCAELTDLGFAPPPAWTAHLGS